jgi:hypothetical protein
MASSLGPSKLLVFGPSGVHASAKFTAEGLLEPLFRPFRSRILGSLASGRMPATQTVPRFCPVPRITMATYEEENGDDDRRFSRSAKTPQEDH